MNFWVFPGGVRRGGVMNRKEFLEFVSKNFNIGGDAMRLIDNILLYAERIVDLDERRGFLNDTLMDAIGLTEEEIAKISL